VSVDPVVDAVMVTVGGAMSFRVTVTLLRQPGFQARGLTRGFASPPHGGFAFIEKGSSLRAAAITHKGANAKRFQVP
jgi:hypothetical protein